MIDITDQGLVRRFFFVRSKKILMPTITIYLLLFHEVLLQIQKAFKNISILNNTHIFLAFPVFLSTKQLKYPYHFHAVYWYWKKKFSIKFNTSKNTPITFNLKLYLETNTVYKNTLRNKTLMQKLYITSKITEISIQSTSQSRIRDNKPYAHTKISKSPRANQKKTRIPL